MLRNVIGQQIAYDELYSANQMAAYSFHITNDPLTRYLRDRRLIRGVSALKKNKDDILNWSVLVVCGGVGGEGIFFKRNGFENVTVSDISGNSLKLCNIFDPSIVTLKLNGENLELPDDSYDLVVVQDGLHHLPRPVSGFTEMLRVARRAIMVIEPYNSFVGNLVGTEWELTGNETNYVFRWDKDLVNQTVKSFLLKNYKQIKVLRFWDHSLMVLKVINKLPKTWRLRSTKIIYSLLKPANRLGNMMVAVIEK